MFGERLTALRKNAKMSQSELASKLGVSQTAIYKYEKNQSEPDIQSLLLISDIFGVTLPYLLGRERDIDQTKSQPDAIIDGGLRSEIIRIFDGLSGSGREQALSYLRFLAADADRKADP